MYKLLFLGSCFFFQAAQAQVQDSLPAFHSDHMLQSNIKLTKPARDTLKQYTSFVNIDPSCGQVKFIKGTIYNNTADTLSITTYIGGTLIGIQEAMNEKGIWQPIEYMFRDGCGNSGSEFDLAPQYFVNFYVPRYCGNFKTKMRLRLRLASSLVISNEWEGTIDRKQFEKPAAAYDRDLKYFYNFLEK